MHNSSPNHNLLNSSIKNNKILYTPISKSIKSFLDYSLISNNSKSKIEVKLNNLKREIGVKYENDLNNSIKNINLTSSIGKIDLKKKTKLDNIILNTDLNNV